MDETLNAVRDSMMRGLGQLTDFFGFSPVMGHLYGALLMSPQALSLDELEEIVGKSKASVSMTMRSLERWGMVHEVWVKGDRRKFYKAESDLWRIITSILESRERREVGIALDVLEDNALRLVQAKETMSKEEQELAEYYLARVKDMQAIFRFAALALEMVVARGALPALDEITTPAVAESEDQVS